VIDKKQPIIVKKINHGEHGHHGGAWKVAFADFVTAMMAFFLLLWLMGSTTKEEKAAIASHFQNPSAVAGVSAVPSPSPVQGKGGSSTSLIDLGGGMELPTVQKEVDVTPQEEPAPPKEAKEEKAPENLKEQEAERQEKKRLDDLMEELNAAIEKSQALEPFKDQLLLDITPEGLRIQIVDKENRPMFDSGKADLKWYTVKILFELSKFINEVPNRISISGHTDAAQFKGRENYSNWELSADRANAARRALVDGGMAEAKIGRVVGLGSSTPFLKDKPFDPINRRIAIIVMNKKTEEAIQKGEGISESYLQQQHDVSLDAVTGNDSKLMDLPMDDLGPDATDIDLDK